MTVQTTFVITWLSITVRTSRKLMQSLLRAPHLAAHLITAHSFLIVQVIGHDLVIMGGVFAAADLPIMASREMLLFMSIGNHSRIYFSVVYH